MFKNFDQNAKTVIGCQNGIMSAIVAQRPYVLVFKTTNWCWNNCAHCCESSGPHNPKTFIPKSVINNYVIQAAQDPLFSREIVFTGGEIMSAYKFADEYYVSDILNHAMDKKLGVDIKTNAGWTGTPLASRVYSDIENVVKRHAPDGGKSNSFKTVIPFQVSLSLDRFHKDAMERNFRFLEHFANADMNGATFTAHISSFSSDDAMIYELIKKLQNADVEVSELMSVASDGESAQKNGLLSLNHNLVVKYSNNAKLFSGGRAKNINGAFHTPLPQFTFATSDFHILTAFDSFGNVTLGENCGKKISVPWHDENGTVKPMADVRNDLIATTRGAEQEYLGQHRFLNWYFNMIRKHIVAGQDTK